MTGDERLLIGIDGGTQSTKVLVFDVSGRVIAQGVCRLRPMAMPGPGRFEHPDDDLWDSLRTASRAAMAQLGERVRDVAAAGLCSIRFCRALLRGDGSLAAPVLSWMDERVGQPQPPTPGVEWVTAASAYLTARLTGRVIDSAANYAGIWPIDRTTWDWTHDAGRLARMGLRPEGLAELVLPGEVLGRITTAAARATGLPAGIPVVATANDKAVEALGNGLLDPDQLMLSLGTYIAALRPATAHLPDGPDRWTNFACLPHRYLDESSGIRRGLATLSWLRDLVGTELSQRAATAGVASEEIMNRAAAQVPPGSRGLLTLLDWLAPTDQPQRRGGMIGFDARHGWPEMYRSILEGIALTMRQRTEALLAAANRKATSILVAGGGSASDPMMQIVADVFELPASRTAVTSGAGLGAAICAAVAAGIHPDFRQAVTAMVHPGATFHPVPDAVRIYRRLLPVYTRLPTELDATLHRLHDLGL